MVSGLRVRKTVCLCCKMSTMTKNKNKHRECVIYFVRLSWFVSLLDVRSATVAFTRDQQASLWFRRQLDTSHHAISSWYSKIDFRSKSVTRIAIRMSGRYRQRCYMLLVVENELSLGKWNATRTGWSIPPALLYAPTTRILTLIRKIKISCKPSRNPGIRSV